MSKLLQLTLAIATIATANAEPRKRRHKPEPNWIIERQTTYQIQGVPTSRRIIGKREFDIYRNGAVFEKGTRVR